MLQPARQLARKGVDRRNFERQPDVGDPRDEFAALLDQGRGVPGKLRDRAQQLRRGARDRRAFRPSRRARREWSAADRPGRACDNPPRNPEDG